MSKNAETLTAEKAFDVVSGFFWHNQYRELCDYREGVGNDVIDSGMEGLADPFGRDQYQWVKMIATLQSFLADVLEEQGGEDCVLSTFTSPPDSTRSRMA